MGTAMILEIKKNNVCEIRNSNFQNHEWTQVLNSQLFINHSFRLKIIRRCAMLIVTKTNRNIACEDYSSENVPHLKLNFVNLVQLLETHNIYAPGFYVRSTVVHLMLGCLFQHILYRSSFLWVATIQNLLLVTVWRIHRTRLLKLDCNLGLDINQSN